MFAACLFLGKWEQTGLVTPDNVEKDQRNDSSHGHLNELMRLLGLCIGTGKELTMVTALPNSSPARGDDIM